MSHLPKFFFDFETMQSRHDNDNVFMEPYQCVVRHNGENTVFNAIEYPDLVPSILNHIFELSRKHWLNLMRDDDKIEYMMAKFGKKSYWIPRCIMIAHNAYFDVQFLRKYLCNTSLTCRGSRLLRGSCSQLSNRWYYTGGNPSARNCYMCIEFIDSMSHINTRLSAFPSMFALENIEKDVFPYTLANSTTLFDQCGEVKLTDAKDHMKPEAYEILRERITNPDNKQKFDVSTKRGRIYFNLWFYSSYYCELDCELLEKGYMKYRELVLRALNLDILGIWTTASLADTYLYTKGVYENVWEVSGSVRKFLEKSVVGGRCMTARNLKQLTTDIVEDFDAVSL